MKTLICLTLILALTSCSITRPITPALMTIEYKVAKYPFSDGTRAYTWYVTPLGIDGTRYFHAGVELGMLCFGKFILNGNTISAHGIKAKEGDRVIAVPPRGEMQIILLTKTID